MLSVELKTKIDNIISDSKKLRVWVIYEKCKKEIQDTYDYLEAIKYIVEKLGV